jgi:excisionase family DNA binding protein
VLASAKPKTRNRAPRRPDAPPPRQLVDLETFERQVGVSSRTVRRWIRAGVLPAYRLAGRGLLRVDLNDLDKVATPADPESVSA